MSTTIAVHRLTQADLAALATGRGGPSALRVLQAGQLGKHMLLLREVVRTAEALGGDEAGAARRSYNVIAAAEAREPVITRRVLAYPPIGSWGVNCLAGLRAGVPAGEAGLAHLAAIGAVVALRVGIACELRVPAPGGRAVLPTLGVALVPAEHATVRVTAEAAAVHGGGACVPVPDRPELDAPGWQGLRRLSAEHAGVRLEVSLDDLDPFRDSEGLGVAPRLGAAEVAQWQGRLERVWRLLVDTAPGYAEAMASGLRCVVPLRQVEPGRGVSATSGHAFGAVFMTPPPDDLPFLVGLLHEYQHSKLNALLHLVDLHDGDDARYYSPWRDDPRPLDGLLHGAYAYLAVADFWRLRAMADGRDGDRGRDLARFEFLRWREAIVRSTRALHASGRLTASGAAFVARMGAHARSWAAGTVPAQTRRWAQDALTDHRVAWRARNVRVDGAAADLLARDWLAGRPPSARLVAATVRIRSPLPRSPLGVRNDRLEMVQRRLGGEAFSGGLIGDVAYADGDFAAAAAAFRTRVAQEPDRAEAWAGLALTDPAAGRWKAPELVAAVYRRVLARGLAAPDLDALSSWLAGVDVSVADW